MAIEFQNYIQIAGVIDQTEAQLLIDCGVTCLGFPLRLPVHKEDLSEESVAQIIQTFQPPVCGVLITYLDCAEGIHTLCQQLGTPIVQLHGDISESELEHLKTLASGLQIIKSLVVRQHNMAELEETAQRLAPYVDAFITDTFDPTTGATGATGKTHDWSVTRRLIESTSRPVILAGGLTPKNVRTAILEVRPAGVDVHTGVEDATGRKTRDRVIPFLSETREGFARL